MKFSIVTTCLNSAHTIQKTIESILSQQGPFEIEYIITDAGSKDGTLDIIRSYGDRIRLIDAKGLNQSQGINLGLRESSGEVVAFLNADDLYEKDTLSEVARLFSLSPNKKWLVGRCRIIDESDREFHRWITDYKGWLLRHYSYFTLLIENYICQPAVFFRREILTDYGYFSEDENFVMDYEYWLRIGHENQPIVCNSFLAAFRRIEGTKSNTSYFQQFKDDMRIAFKYAKKHGHQLAMPFKFLSYIRTVGVYPFLYK